MYTKTQMLKMWVVVLFFVVGEQSAWSADQCKVVFSESSQDSNRFGRRRTLLRLGLEETLGAFGEVDQSFRIVNPNASKVSRLISNFQQKWPAVRLYYTTHEQNIKAGVARINILMRQGKHASMMFIPISLISNYSLIEKEMVRIEESLQKIDRLLSEPIDFRVTQLTSMGFILEIDDFYGRPSHPQLAWMWRRAQAHGFKYKITNPYLDKSFPRHVMGMSYGRMITLLDAIFLTDSQDFAAYLAHEIHHSTNYARFDNMGDPSSLIYFKPGDFNSSGLFGYANFGYNNGFQSDEMEAWLITERMGVPVSESQVSYKRFLKNQIYWLMELKSALRHETIFSMEEQFQQNVSYMTVRIFAGTQQEVIIGIPIHVEKYLELGVLDYFEGTINKRLHQLQNRFRILEQGNANLDHY